ncbi:MAG: RNase P subunit p30 family protein [Candidatus Bathyarchaeia archaeon]
MKFADLHVWPKLSDKQETLELLRYAIGLGFGLVGLHVPKDSDLSVFKDFFTDLETRGIKIAKRLDITLPPQSSAQDSIPLSQEYDIIAIRPHSLEQIKKTDGISNLITLPLTASWLTKLGDVQSMPLPFEIELRQLFELSGPTLKNTLESVKRLIQTTQAKGQTFVFSSGARSHFELRTPKDIACLARFFGLTAMEITGLTRLPWRILSK